MRPEPAAEAGKRNGEQLSEAEIEARWRAIHQPFRRGVAALLDKRGAAALVAIHSFTPRLRGGPPRPMAVGLLARSDLALPRALQAALQSAVPGEEVVLNAPYRIEDASDYTIPVHGESRGLPHVLVEIRNDLIAEPGGVARWTGLLAGALRAALPSMHERMHAHGL